jgi:hypothetical protein
MPSLLAISHQQEPSQTDQASRDAATTRLKWRYFGLLVALTLIDGMQTAQIIERYGTIAEVNPLMRMAIEQFSIAGLWWIKGAAIVVVALTLSRVRSGVLLGVLLLFALVVTSNLAQILAVG